MPPSGADVAIWGWRFSLHSLLDRDPICTTESYPLPRRLNTAAQLIRTGAVVLATAALAGCSANSSDAPPPTIVPAQAAQSPPVTGTPAGIVRPLAGHAQAAVFDPATASLAVLSPGVGGRSTITVVPSSGAARPVPLPSPATALTGDNDGRVYASTRGGYFRVDIRAGTANRVDIEGQSGTDFTAIAWRAADLLRTALELPSRRQPLVHPVDVDRPRGNRARGRQCAGGPPIVPAGSGGGRLDRGRAARGHGADPARAPRARRARPRPGDRRAHAGPRPRRRRRPDAGGAQSTACGGLRRRRVPVRPEPRGVRRNRRQSLALGGNPDPPRRPPRPGPPAARAARARGGAESSAGWWPTRGPASLTNKAGRTPSRWRPPRPSCRRTARARPPPCPGKWSQNPFSDADPRRTARCPRSRRRRSPPSRRAIEAGALARQGANSVDAVAGGLAPRRVLDLPAPVVDRVAALCEVRQVRRIPGEEVREHRRWRVIAAKV